MESAQRNDTHRYSRSRGIPRLPRRAISHWYKRKFDVDIDPEQESNCCHRLKEGLAHLALAALSPW
ncbi:MAG: hypothetical protein R3E89_00855 [Thiolinea sp.]